MDSLTSELKQFLIDRGVNMVGFADLTPFAKDDMTYGISVAVAVPPQTIQGIQNAPTMEYYNAYHDINHLLDEIVTAGAEFLKSKGYRAFAQTTDTVVESDDYRTGMPHKTVAARAGLGWIGKCALLVTEEYGSAVRLSSLVTDAPLECGIPVTASRCGSCTACTEACPGKAVSGRLWSADTDRDEFFNPYSCRKAARELAALHIQKEITLCGKCIQVCPYTQRYLRSALN